MSVHTSAFLLALVVPRNTRKISLLRLLPPTAQTPKASLVARKIRQPTEAFMTVLWCLENSFLAKDCDASRAASIPYTSRARSARSIGARFFMVTSFSVLCVHPMCRKSLGLHGLFGYAPLHR